MKILSPVVVVILALSVFVPASKTVSSLPQTSKVVQAQNPTVDDRLQVAIKETVLVSLKKGNPLSGQLVRFTPKNIVLVAGDQEKILAIAEIKSVEFQGDLWVLDQNGIPRRIRGEKTITKQQTTWQNVPLTALQIQQNKTALLRLGSILNSNDLKDLQDQSKDVVYVLDMIQVEPLGQKMTIIATPFDRRSLL